MAVVHGGQMLFGMVDRVPRLCYVATLFFHINLVPLIPLRTYVLVEPSRRDHHLGQPIPLSWKSVLMAWMRIGLLGGMGASVVAVSISMDRNINESALVISAATLIGSAFLFALSMLSNRASVARAVELGAILGIDALEMEHILSTSRQSLRGLGRWYLKSFSLDEGPPSRLSCRGTDSASQSSQPARERLKD
jgi:hypothetical protein